MQHPDLPFDSNLQDDNIDFKRYISLFLSNWYWFAIALFIALTVAYAVNRYSQKIYSVSSTLLIKDDQFTTKNTNMESVIPGGDIFKSQQNLKNEMGILQSFSLNDSVIRRLSDFHIVYVNIGRRGIVESRMYKTCVFKVICDSNSIQTRNLKVGIVVLSDSTYRIEFNAIKYDSVLNFGSRFKKFGFNFVLVPRFPDKKVYNNNGSNKYYFYFIDPQSLASQYRNKLFVAPIEKDASIVTLSVSGDVPEQEADYLNKLMEVYINYGLENKNRTGDSTIKFIDVQLKIILDSLTKAEAEMEKFRESNNFFDLSREGTSIQNRLEKIENEKAAFELQLQYYNYLSEYLKLKDADGSIISPSVMGITDPLLLRMVNELAAAQDQREKLNFNLEAKQPAIVLIEQQIAETKAALVENIKNGISGLRISIAETDRKIENVESEINKLPKTERKLINIQRHYDLNNTVYTYLLEKRAESGIARASNIPDNRIIDYASGSSAGLIKPKNKLNYIIALILGFIIPMTAIILIDFFNDKVIDKRDVESKTKIPVIGYISHSEGKNEIPVLEKPGSSLAESFRSVRTAIKYFVRDNERPVIAVSSTISSEGKTFISINLAVITAMLGKKVLLIGLDLRKPRINKVFESEKSLGMSTYLCGECNYEDVIKQTQVKNLFYAPSGPIPPNPSELIETDQMKAFMEKAKEEFDYIIIDTPPVAIVTDALLLAPYIDLNLFIVRQRYTSRNTLEIVDQLQRRGELKSLAIVINDINTSGYYGYGMRYGNSLGYGYSYGYNYYGKGYYGRYGYSDKNHGYYTEES